MRLWINKKLWAAGLAAVLLLGGAGPAAARVLRALDMTVARGQTNKVVIALDAEGGENAIGLGLCYDTNVLSFVRATLAAEAGLAGVNPPTVNITKTNQGKVWFQCSLGAGEMLEAGTVRLIEVSFRAAAAGGTVTTPVTICDFSPPGQVPSIIDAEVNELSFTRANAVVTVVGSCAYALGTNATAVAAAGASESVNVTAGSGCAWTALNTNSWITITAGTNGSGDGLVSFNVAANTNLAARSAEMVIAGLAYTVSQAGYTCAYEVSPTGRNHGNGAGSNSVNIITTAGCAWTATTTNAWITFATASSGTGSNAAGYLIAANPNAVARVGAIQVADKFLVLTQAAASCSVSLPSNNTNFGPGPANGTFDVTVAGGCGWTAATTNAWITVTGGASGSGSGLVSYSVAANPNTTTRTGRVTVNGPSNAVNFTISQDGQVCTFTLAPASGSHGAGADVGSVAVTTLAGCAWSAFSSNAWITVTSSTNNTGSDVVAYAVAASTNVAGRTGLVVIAGQNFAVAQAGFSCAYTLSPTGRNHGNGAGSNSVNIITTAGCAWTATTTNAWITFATASSGTGSNAAGYLIAANPNAVARVGAIQVADKFLVLTQAAASCSVSLPSNNTNFGPGPANGTFDVTVAGGCGWTAATTNAWITVTGGASGSGSGLVSYSVAANPNTTTRTGRVTVNGPSNAVNFTISQDAVFIPCTYRLSPTNRTHGATAATGTFSLSVSNSCDWELVNTNPWITILSPTNGSGPATFDYSVAANLTVNERTGSVLIAGQELTFIQLGIACDYSLSPSNRPHGYSAATNSITLTVASACAWTIVNSNDWIQFVSPAGGSGSATLDYTVDANPMPLPRTGLVSIADQVLTLVQSAAPCQFALTPASRAHGPTLETGLLAVATSPTCDWTTTTTNSWITITAGASRTGSATAGYRVDANPTGMPRTGRILVGDQTYPVTQTGAPCTFTLAPTSRAHGGATETGTVLVTTLDGCAWSVDNTNPWINILSGTNPTGNATLTYRAAANPSLNPRSGTLQIADKTFLVTQAGFTCAFRLSPTNRNHGYGASTGLVSILTSNGCAWNVVNTNPWVTLTTPAFGDGNGSFGYATTENTLPTERAGLLYIGGQPFQLRQLAATCEVQLTPADRPHGYGATTGTVLIDTPAACAWTASTTNDWITLLSTTNGSGSNLLTYALGANPAALERTGSVTVADQTLTLRQAAAPCLPDLSTTSRTHGYTATTGTLALTLPIGCPWTVVNTNHWLTLTSPANGTGDATLNYSVDANPATTGRTGAVVIAGLTLTLRQLPAPCVFLLTPTNATPTPAATTGLVNFATSDNCPWTLDNTNTWITITEPTTGLGNGSFGYAVAENTTPFTRTALIPVGDKTFRVTQAGVPCTFVLDPASRSHGADAGTNTVAVTVLAGCAWSVASTNPWINILSGASSNGSGNVTYSVDANPLITPRAGLLSVAGQPFTVNQAGADCTYRLSPTNRSHGYGPATGTVSLITLAGCHWDVTNTNDWINLTTAVNGTGPATLTYTLLANPSPVLRLGFVQAASQYLVVTQQAAPCNFSLSTLNRTHGNGTVSNSIAVTTLAGCPWSASTTNDWISFLSPTNATGTGNISYLVMTNVATFWRTGYLMVADQVVTLAQRPTLCNYLLAPSNVVHGVGSESGLISVTAPATCLWTVANTNHWISITTSTNGSGLGSFEYEVSANPTVFTRTGLVFVADQVLTVVQDGTACSFAIAPSSRALGASSATGSVTVTTLNGCNWSVENTNTWIVINSGTAGSGNGLVTYVATANPDALGRTGLVSIAGQSFSLIQAGAACTFTIAPTSRDHASGAETGSITVTTLAGCVWSATSTDNWITITAGASGSGGGPVTYTVAANAAALSRTGLVSVAGHTFAVRQTGVACSFAISSPTNLHGAGVETGSVAVTSPTGCNWTVSNTNSWITILSGTNGSGSAAVDYTLASNGTAAARSGLLTIAGRSFSVIQTGAVCNFVLTPAGNSYGPGATNDAVAVASLPGCTWTVSNTNAWITLTSGTNGAASGTVNFIIASNATSLARSGVITIAGQSFSISQDGTPCTFAITPASRSYNAGATNGTVAVTTIPGCVWTVENPNSWITINSGNGGTGTGTVTLTIATNPVGAARSGVVVIAGESFTVNQAGTPCTYAIAPLGRTNGPAASTGLISVTTITGCAWTANSSNNWITINPPASGAGNGTAGYTVASNTTALLRTGLVAVAGQVFTFIQSGTPCSFSIAPASVTHGPGLETGSVNVTTLVGCAWTVNNTNPWITITSGTNGSGSGTVTYTVSANPNAMARSAVIDIDGRQFDITQLESACSYALTPTAWTHRTGGDTGVVSVVAQGGCGWTAANTNQWITITAGASGSGSGSVTYTVAPQAGVTDRLGAMTIAGQTFTVSQLGSACTYRISPTNRFHGSSAVSNTLSMTASNGCAWTVVNPNPWITILSNAAGSGNAVIGYAVAKNNSAVQRIGLLNCGGEILAITQWGTNCGLALSPASRAHGTGSETGLVTITASATNCAWTLIETNSWITINTPASGSGTGTSNFGYTVSANASTIPRSGVITAGGESFTVSQAGLPCTYSISVTNRAHGSGAESGAVAVTAPAGCAWSVVDNNDWITLTSGGSGTGPGTVNYAVEANPTSLPRTGFLVIAGTTFTLSQSGAPCVFTLAPTNRSHGADGETGNISVTAIAGCGWTVVNTNNWITLSAATNGTSTGSVAYAVAANPGGLARAGVLTIGGKPFAVTQAGQPCTFAISPTNQTHGAGQETGTVSVTSLTGCAWTVSNASPWITILSGTNGSGSSTVTYAVGVNSSTSNRSGELNIAGRNFAVTQAGANCTFALVPASRAHGSGAETGSVGIATVAGCAWAVANPNPWLTITSGTSGSGGGSFGYALSANPGSTARTGVVTIAGQAFTLTQAGLVCSYVLSPTSRSHGAAPSAASFTVSATAGCAWSAVNSNAWITITPGGSGIGSGTVNYSVATNPGPPRAGNLVAGGQVFAVNQESVLRMVRVVNMNVAPGQTNKVLVVLDALGDENALGFNLRYNTGVLAYVKAVKGAEAGAAFATLNVNASATSAGRVGFGMALGTGEAFPAGSNTLVEVSFRALSNAAPGVTAITFTNIPIAPQVVDVQAAEVTAAYVGGNVTVSGTCTYGLASNAVSFTASGGPGSAGVTAGTGCAWSVSNTNSWIAITSGSGGAGDGRVDFVVSPNPETWGRTGVVVVAGLSFTVTQAAVPCSYVLVPAQQIHTAAAGVGSLGLTSLGGCAWSVSSPDGWITVTPPASGSGSATVNYSVAANASSFARTGLVTVAGQTAAIVQAGAPCTYGLSPSSRVHTVSSETGLVTVTAVAGCPWTAGTTNGWITITAGASGVGPGSLGYRVAFNPDFTGRTGSISVADQSFTVSQPGNTCAVTLSPPGLSHASGISTGLVSVVASNGCTWTVSNTNSWITITSSTNGSGSNTVRYTIPANSLGAERSGVLGIGGRPFTVSQAGAACVFAIAPAGRTHGYGSESDVLSVATFAGCPWSVRTTNIWITITSPTNAVGGGAVSYSIGANPGGFARTGVVMVADQLFVVTQAGAPCFYILSPASRTHSYFSETGSVSLSTVLGCPWTVQNTNTWITILSETNGAGPWGVSYSVAANPAGLARTGSVSIANQTLTVSQAAAPCAWALGQSNRVVGHLASTGAVSVATLAGCAWAVANTNDWVTILSAAANSGPGAVVYAVQQNESSFGRTGVVTVAGQQFTLAQAGAPCIYALSPSNRSHGYGASTNLISLSSVVGCPWSVSNTNGWVTILSSLGGTGSASLTYAVASNGTALARSGVVSVAGQSVTLAQDGAPCGFVLSPPAGLHSASAQTGLVAVAAVPGCSWSVDNSNGWINITTPTNGFGNGSFGYLISSNNSPAARTGLVRVMDQLFTVSQSGFVCSFVLAPTSGSLAAGNVTGLVSVITSPLCDWVVVNTNAWIAIKSGSSGSGDGLVRYTAAANPNPSLRTGHLVIGGVPFLVSQLGSPCTYALSPTNRLHGSALESNAVSVLTVVECSWTVANTNAWITLLSPTNGSGNSVVSYFVEPNPSGMDRTGRVTIAGQVFPITQLGAACLHAFTTNGAAFGPAPATGSVSIVSTLACPWTVVNTNTWITITSGGSGSNSAIVNYSIAVNANPVDRSGNLRVGASLYSITQTGIVCTFTLSATNFNHGSGSETGAVSVLTSNLCPWMVSTTNAWITVLSSTNPTGSAVVTYSLTSNPTPFSRFGSMVIAGQAYSIAQAGFTCVFAVNPAGRTHAFGAVTGLVSVTTSNLCSWSVQSSNGWITFLGNTNRTNGGFVSYVAAANPSLMTRTGTVSIAGQPFTITQYGVAFVQASNKTATCGTAWGFDPPFSSGTCADTNLVLNILTTVTNAGCGSAYTATRRWDAQDTCGNRMTVTQVVNVVVAGPPVMACAPFKTVECGSGWTFDEPTATDSCGGLGVTVQVTGTVTNSAGACGGAFRATRSWLVTDGCSNQAACSQTVQTIDTTPPTLACVLNRTVECGAAWSFDAPGVTDSCGGTNVTLRVVSTSTNFTGLCGSSFTATRIWEAADGCSNKASCSQTITVVDTTPPAITCPGTKSVECGLAWSFDQPVAIDTCAGTNVTVRVVTTVTNVAGACGNTFTAIRTWEALDACSNRSTCAQLVMVVDTTPPGIACPANKTAEFGSVWAFEAPTGSDTCGTAVSFRIVSTVTNSAGFCGNTYSVTRSWEALDGCSNRSVTCSQTVQLIDTVAPGLACPANKLVACGSAWTFDQPSAFDMVSGTNVAIVVVSTVTNGSCASGFSATRTWQAMDGCSNRSALCSQTVSAASQASIAGTIFYHPTNYPAPAPTAKRLSPVPVQVTSSTNLTVFTAADGSYSVTVNAAGTYDVTPRLTNSSPFANGVSTIDISLIRRHILNIAPLDTPYKLLAADVNGSRSVTTLDLTFIRRLILGSTNTLPLGLWRFVPADYAFTNTAAPWDAPTNRSHANLVTAVANQDFMAMKLGDVNNSWAPPVSFAGFAPAAQRAALVNFGPEVTFTVSQHTNQPGDLVAVKVSAGSFRDVTSAQWTLAWDPAVVRYAGTGKLGLKGLTSANFGSTFADGGQLTFSWEDPDAVGVTAADGSTLFTANFEVIGAAGSVSPLLLSSGVTEAEVGVAFSEAHFRSVHGQISVVAPVGELPAPPLLGRAVHANGAFGVPQQTVAGKRYILEYTDTLPSTNWTALPPIIGDGSVMTLTDPNANRPQRFYRLRIE